MHGAEGAEREGHGCPTTAAADAALELPILLAVCSEGVACDLTLVAGETHATWARLLIRSLVPGVAAESASNFSSNSLVLRCAKCTTPGAAEICESRFRLPPRLLSLSNRRCQNAQKRTRTTTRTGAPVKANECANVMCLFAGAAAG